MSFARYTDGMVGQRACVTGSPAAKYTKRVLDRRAASVRTAAAVPATFYAQTVLDGDAGKRAKIQQGVVVYTHTARVA